MKRGFVLGGGAVKPSLLSPRETQSSVWHFAFNGIIELSFLFLGSFYLFLSLLWTRLTLYHPFSLSNCEKLKTYIIVQQQAWEHELKCTGNRAPLLPPVVKTDLNIRAIFSLFLFFSFSEVCLNFFFHKKIYQYTSTVYEEKVTRLTGGGRGSK